MYIFNEPVSGAVCGCLGCPELALGEKVGATSFWLCCEQIGLEFISLNGKKLCCFTCEHVVVVEPGPISDVDAISSVLRKGLRFFLACDYFGLN